MLRDMKPPLSLGHSTDEERAALEAGLRSPHAFTVRRCQSLLARAEGQKPSQIATSLHCAPQTVRNVVHAFDERGLARVQRRSNVPLGVEPVLNVEKREHVRAILHQSPCNFGQPADDKPRPPSEKDGTGQGPRGQSPCLLWTLCAGNQPHAVALCAGTSRQRGHLHLSHVADHILCRSGETGPRAHLAQRLLACQLRCA
jgi:Homeodomain-like domain